MSPRQIQGLAGVVWALAHVDDDVCRYFRDLGFVVTWDANRSRSNYWYEICDPDGALLIQIDFGAPLAEIIVDLPRLAQGKDGQDQTTPTWFVRGPAENLARVAERMHSDGGKAEA